MKSDVLMAKDLLRAGWRNRGVRLGGASWRRDLTGGSDAEIGLMEERRLFQKTP